MKFFFLFFFFFGCVSTLSAQQGVVDDSFIQRYEATRVDWTQSRILSTGVSSFTNSGEDVAQKSILAERQARIRATRNLYDDLNRIYLDSSSTVGEIADNDQRVKSSLSHLTRQIVVAHRTRVPGSRFLKEVYVVLDLQDRETRHFIPELFFVSPESGVKSTSESVLAGQCRVFIDTADVDIFPAIVPAIVDGQGSMLFRASTLGPDRANTKALINYIRNTDSARFFRPALPDGQTLWLRAMGAHGENNTDIMLSDESSERFVEALSRSVDGCNVTILMP